MPKRLPPWSWHGLAGTVLAACVGISYGTTLIVTALSPSPITDRGAEVLTNLGSVLVGAVATWLGTQGNRQDTSDTEADGPYVEPDDPRYTSQTTTTTTTDSAVGAAPSTKPEPTEDQYIDDVKEAT